MTLARSFIECEKTGQACPTSLEYLWQS